MITQGFPLGVLAQGAGAPTPYDPGMMTFDGSTGYYQKSGVVTAGNRVTVVLKINRSAFTGGGNEIAFVLDGPTGRQSTQIAVFASDHATTASRNKVRVFVENSAGSALCYIESDVDVVNSQDHLVFFSFNGDTGTAILYVDGFDADNATFASRVAPTTGTLDTGASHKVTLGAYSTPHSYYGGEIGYFGHAVDRALTNPTDFYHPANGLQELDETTWTEWGGSSPQFWNQYGTMTDNKGSSGNMTANGTITGPA